MVANWLLEEIADEIRRWTGERRHAELARAKWVVVGDRRAMGFDLGGFVAAEEE